MTDGWTELKDRFLTEKDAFKSLILEKHHAKKEEYKFWQDTVKRACNDKDQLSHRRILEFEKYKKHLVRRVHASTSQASDEVPAAKVSASMPCLLHTYISDLHITCNPK